MNRRDTSLDFLRFVAIFMVLGFHSPVPDPSTPLGRAILWPWREFGWAGVDLFFVLSGFLVGGLLMSEYKKKGSISLRTFFTRRALKIWPQYYVFLGFMMLRAWRGGQPLSAYAGSLLNVQNYTGPIVNYTWSLAVEEHFYILLAISIAIIVKRGTLNVRTVGALFLGALVISLGSRITMMALHADRMQTRIFTHCSLDTLALGVLLAAVYHFEPETYRRLASKRGLLWTCVAVGVAAQAFHHYDPFALSVGLNLVALGAASLLLLTFAPESGSFFDRIRHSKVHRGLAWVGQHSYGIYLWHWPAGAALSVFVYRKLQSHLPEAATWLAASTVWVILPIVAGIVATWVVEQPMLRLRERLFPSKTGALQLGTATPSATLVQPVITPTHQEVHPQKTPEKIS